MMPFDSYYACLLLISQETLSSVYLKVIPTGFISCPFLLIMEKAVKIDTCPSCSGFLDPSQLFPCQTDWQCEYILQASGWIGCQLASHPDTKLAYRHRADRHLALMADLRAIWLRVHARSRRDGNFWVFSQHTDILMTVKPWLRLPWLLLPQAIMLRW